MKPYLITFYPSILVLSGQFRFRRLFTTLVANRTKLIIEQLLDFFSRAEFSTRP